MTVGGTLVYGALHGAFTHGARIKVLKKRENDYFDAIENEMRKCEKGNKKSKIIALIDLK